MAQITERFDTYGREWCLICQGYFTSGHLCQGAPQGLQKQVVNNQVDISIQKKAPMKCPACDGWGFKVDSHDNKHYDCRGCDGKALLWI